jgi:hypothetical protein
MKNTHEIINGLTPETVAAWMVAQRNAAGIPESAQLSCSASTELGAKWAIYGSFIFDGDYQWVSSDGKTMHDAIDDFRRKYPATPAMRAEKLRAEAAALIAKADALTPKEAA